MKPFRFLIIFGLALLCAPVSANESRPSDYELMIQNAGTASTVAPLDTGAHVPTDKLGSGTADSTKFLRGDQTWATPAGGGGAEWGGITGTLSAQTDLQSALDGKESSGTFSGIGACAANQWASTLNDTAAPTCTQPGFSNLSGAATDAQVPNTITVDLSAAATALAANGGNCSGNNFALGVDASGVGECAQPGFANLSGTASDAQLASSYSGIGACAANQWASTLNDNAAPSCTQPAFTNLSGTATIAQGGTGQTTATAAFDGLDPLTTAGDVLTHNGTNSIRLAKGTANQVLAMNSGATAVEWQTPGAGSGIVSAVKLTSNATANSTTTGVEITGLQKSLTAGTYAFKYLVVYQAGATTTGVQFGVNYTGTATTFVVSMRYSATGTAASTGAATQVASGATGNVGETLAARSESTTAPNLGATVSVDAANSNMLVIIEGVMIVSDSGDLELWHASEVAASSTVMAGSALILTTL